MESMETVRTFLGWCTLINVGLLTLSTVAVLLMRGFVTRLHGKMFGLSEEDVSREIYRYLALYKIAILVLSIVPYVALSIMTSSG